MTQIGWQVCDYIALPWGKDFYQGGGGHCPPPWRRPWSRAELVASTNCISSEPDTTSYKNEWNTNPEIDPRQRSRIMTLLEEFRDVFADNPKKPSITTHVNHAIDTGNAPPIKAKSIRVSPQIDSEINLQDIPDVGKWDHPTFLFPVGKQGHTSPEKGCVI